VLLYVDLREVGVRARWPLCFLCATWGAPHTRSPASAPGRAFHARRALGVACARQQPLGRAFVRHGHQAGISFVLPCFISLPGTLLFVADGSAPSHSPTPYEPRRPAPTAGCASPPSEATHPCLAAVSGPVFPLVCGWAPRGIHVFVFRRVATRGSSVRPGSLYKGSSHSPAPPHRPMIRPDGPSFPPG